MSEDATNGGFSSDARLPRDLDDLYSLQRAAAAEECNSASSSSSPLQSRKRSRRRDGNDDQTFSDRCRRVASLHRSADALARELREQLVGRKQRVEEKRRAIEALVDEHQRLAIEIHNCETALQAMRVELNR
jgi:hypothetical protein